MSRTAMTARWRVFALLGCIGLVGSSSAHAAGFAVTEQTARGLGIAHAGDVAGAEDASTTFTNPAGLTLLSGTQVVGSAFLISPFSEFTNTGSTLNPAVGGGPLTGGNSGDPTGNEFLSTFFVAHELTPRVHLGLGLSVPFGLSTDWEAGWVGRYHALFSSLVNLNLSPAVGFRLTDELAIGAGVDISHVSAELTSALDLGSICQIYGAELGASPETCNAFGLEPQRVDGKVSADLDGWGAGYNLGFMYMPTPRTRFGLNFHSGISLDLSGPTSFRVPESARVIQEASGALVDSGSHAALELPARLSFGFFQELGSDWAVMADITWTQWSRFQTLVLEFDNPAQPPIIEPQNWNDVFRYTLGVRWTASEAWELRLGTAYDETPIPSSTYRRPRIPDSDRIWLATGVGFTPLTNLRIDIGYARLFGLDTKTHATDAITGHVLRGEFTGGGANIFGVQLTYDLVPGWFGEQVEAF